MPFFHHNGWPVSREDTATSAAGPAACSRAVTGIGFPIPALRRFSISVCLIDKDRSLSIHPRPSRVAPSNRGMLPDPVHSPEDAEGAKKKNKNKKKKKKSGGGGGDNQPNQNADEAEGASTEADGSSPETARAAGGSVSSPGTDASVTEATALAAFDPSSPEDRPMTQSLRSAAC
jgi:hypothetical protein